MAEMVAGEKKEDHTDSESDLDENGGEGGEYSPEAVDSSNTFGDDMLQMALKMATGLFYFFFLVSYLDIIVDNWDGHLPFVKHYLIVTIYLTSRAR